MFPRSDKNSRRFHASRKTYRRLRRTAYWSLLSTALVLGASTLQASHAAGSVPFITLPVEVIGADGTTTSVSFYVPASALTGGAIVGLQMRIHGSSYTNKISVQINNNTWTLLNNNTVSVGGQASHYGGIGGPIATMDVTLPLSANTLSVGTNTLRFRFNGTDGVSIGFRVLSFNFVRANGQTILPPSTFTQEDPSQWKPPLNTTSDIAAGKQLYQNATLLESSLSGNVIKAHCADCHTQDGRDLKYFNFSNNSIIARAHHHHLSVQQGQQIASYIRSLQTPSPGRPWNPPYQPGPGLDSAPLANWSAGAGLSWALGRDADTLDYIFPNGINKEAIAPQGNISSREMPVAFQLPDWNHWLPRVHPKDAWGVEFTSSNMLKMYAGEGIGPSTWNLRTRLSTNSTYASQKYGYISDASGWNDAIRTFMGNKVATDQTHWSRAFAENIYSTRLWQLVKTWELHHEFDLEGVGQQLFGSTLGEPRMWLAQNVWQTAPNQFGMLQSQVVGISPLEQSTQVSDTSRATAYVNNSWLYMAMILSNGNKSAVSDFSWEYFLGQVDYSTLAGDTQVARKLFMAIKSIQATLAPDDPAGNRRNWRPFLSSPTAVGIATSGVTNVNSWNSVDPVIRQSVFQAFLDSWTAKNALYAPMQYKPHNYDPNYVAPTRTSMGYSMYQNISASKKLGLDTNGAVDWAETMWKAAPQAWDALRP